MEIDQGMEKNSTEINSKKRKLMDDEQLDLPSPKRKRMEQRSSGSKQESSFPQDLELEVKTLNSEKDSNSFVGDPNSIFSLYPADIFEPEFPKAHYTYDQPSTSNCSSDSLKDTLSTLNRKSKISAMDDRKPDTSNLKVAALQLQSEPQKPELQPPGFGNYADSICSRSKNDEVEELQDESSNLYVLSSGRWSIKQNTQFGTRKPTTIDQEFEKYFSMLILL